MLYFLIYKLSNLNIYREKTMHRLVHKFMNTTKNLRMLSEDISYLLQRAHRYNRGHTSLLNYFLSKKKKTDYASLYQIVTLIF